ncbi:hypothetical protein VTL71DRAFT_1356 [Oculimacula yallundae]|uniref:Uncharacterized protein n=1 Tax=Oculimacula yallundae TaxID=86028 RepID=A0ABR4CBM5_9HELO
MPVQSGLDQQKMKEARSGDRWPVRSQMSCLTVQIHATTSPPVQGEARQGKTRLRSSAPSDDTQTEVGWVGAATHTALGGTVPCSGRIISDQQGVVKDSESSNKSLRSRPPAELWLHRWGCLGKSREHGV